MSRSLNVYVVTGATWPFKPTVWLTKRDARKAAAKLRRAIRAYSDNKRLRTCGVVIEGRSKRDTVYSPWLGPDALATTYNAVEQAPSECPPNCPLCIEA
jgi:hypothetical protein